MNIPGLTELIGYEKPICTTIFEGKTVKPVILIATASINDKNIFNNGLYQNILILYRLYEILGYNVYLLTDNDETMSDYKVIKPDQLIHKPVEIKYYIEIGMSVSAAFRDYLKEIGAKRVKLYLGNILNIDIESINLTPGIDFPHHVSGDLDKIWTSPHYGQHIEYTAVINKLSPSNSSIVPYVWDRCFIKEITKWVKPDNWKETNIVITEPNISYQKNYLLPLLLVESFAKEVPEWKGKVIIMNSDRVKGNIHVMKTVLPSLDISSRLVLEQRKTILEMTRDYSSSVFIGHQWNNEFNYMTFELMLAGFPLLHNSDAWSTFGYYWNTSRWSSSIELLKDVLIGHSDRLELYKSHAEQLAWHHSIHNPKIQETWKKILEQC